MKVARETWFVRRNRVQNQNYKHQDEIYSEIKKTKISLLSIRLEETAKALFKWLSKHQFQINNSDQSQQKQTAQRTNQNSERLPIICSKCGESCAYKGANGFGSACHWLNYWPESFSRRSRNPLITFVRYRSTFRTVI